MKVVIVTLCLFAAAYGAALSKAVTDQPDISKVAVSLPKAVIDQANLLKLMNLRYCPIVNCVLNVQCLDDEEQQDQLFNWNGMKCPGCQTCTRLNPVNIIKRKTSVVDLSKVLHYEFMGCPIPMCAQRYTCAKEDMYQGYLPTTTGKKCPGCMMCRHPLDKIEHPVLQI